MEFRPLAKSVYLPKRNFSKFSIPNPLRKNRGLYGGKEKPAGIYNRVLSFTLLSIHVCVYSGGDKTISVKPEKKGKKFSNQFNEQHIPQQLHNSQSEPQTTVIDTRTVVLRKEKYGLLPLFL
jgi:hypothetical protein